jgi:hypothetical protein
MSNQSLIVSPTRDPYSVRTADGRTLSVPTGWELLPPGDAGLTRRVKAATVTWTVQEKVGRKMFSRGVWADAAVIAAERAKLDGERSTPQYAAKLAAAKVRRDKEQAAYVEDFRGAVLAFLAFAPRHAPLADKLATAIAAHATPVGSGTVARTERIPIQQRAEAAVIAWLRHQTTGYDQMSIARVKGARREVRRHLAERSRQLLQAYREGREVDAGACSLQRALA